ncbi:C4-dicarboxylate transport transcriptional regulatory protein DctD [Sphingomonas sp. EC-HK361]|uniref:sigma-54-dependent transcriptional regulator n=1 Tax=Sphingomonas sp. EC-HK361 TaxID=2038397 RepID=UPI0012554564|nr:sigma-54 dependent transcriptional regulator [Sphingomonas sp. EC-HK361]VVS98084.1 C4-dicarboxylate transport transcriptional regulatory protein DctD [Sphingomonas sp. EC-HK361]
MTGSASRLEIILIEDDHDLRLATAQSFGLAGFNVRAFAGAEAALALATPSFEGVVVSDIRMPRMDGFQLLSAVRAVDPEVPVILITGHGDVPMAVAAMKEGAYDFLTKPFSVDHLTLAVSRALERRRLVIENRQLRAVAEAGEAASPLIGNSRAITQLRAQIQRLAQASIDVLIEGETGTGKELAALMLHRQGPRRQKPFVAIDCPTLDDATAAIELFGHAADVVPHTRLARTGLIVEANGGTLLLDDIDALSPDLQTKLLRVIEEREVHPLGAPRPEAVTIRIIATSKSDLRASVDRDGFRADLYHRLATTHLRLPPLRERESDAMILYAIFVEQAKAQLGRPDHVIGDAERRHVLAYEWPGNVRELRNYAFGTLLGDMAVLPDDTDLRGRVAAFEKQLISNALKATKGNVSAAIKELKIPRKTFYEKVGRLSIDPASFRP